jgi:hypothetical protein
MRRTLLFAAAVLVAAFVAAPASGAARAPKRLSCHSGVTVFHEGGARLFWAPRGRRGQQHPVWYACSSTLRRPHAFIRGGLTTDDVVAHFRAAGSRVGFVWESLKPNGFGVDQKVVVGWVDLATGASRQTVVGAPGGPGSPNFGDVKGVAVGDDGAMALVVKADDDSEVIGFAPMLANRLGDPRALFTVSAGDVLPRSLTLANGAITWTTRSGAPGTVSVTG